MVSFGLHVEKVWTINLSEIITHAKSIVESTAGNYINPLKLSPLISTEGILLVIKMKTKFS